MLECCLPQVMVWPVEGFLSRFLVLLVSSPLSCESGLCEGHGSSKLRYLVCKQSWECNNGFRSGCS